MKIKIVSRISELPMTDEEELVYDVYVGFTGIPTTFPFHTKWKIDKVGWTKEELLEWFEKIALGYYQEVVIKLWNYEYTINISGFYLSIYYSFLLRV